MGKRNKYGGYIPGVTEVHDRGFFEACLIDRNWAKGDQWLHTEVCYLHNKVVHGQIVYNVLGFLLSTVLAFFYLDHDGAGYDPGGAGGGSAGAVLQRPLYKAD